MKHKNSFKGSVRGRLPDGAANPVDLHVGRRLKEARLEHGYSQERLAKEMGITFQQVQKYEKGLNRIGASRLWDLAQVLEEPIDYFYAGMDEADQNQSPRKINVLREDNGDFKLDELVLTPDDMALLMAYKKIRNPSIAKSILSLVKSLSVKGLHRETFDYNDLSDDSGEIK